MVDSLYERLNPIIQSFNGHIAVVIADHDNSRVLNGEEQTIAASVIKVPIMLYALHEAQHGRLDLHKKIAITSTVGGSGVLSALTSPPPQSILNLIELMIIVSDNTASNLLLKELGIQPINAFCEKLHLKQTVIERYFMDEEAQLKGKNNYVSANDLHKLLLLIGEENEVLTNDSRQLALNIMKNQQFTDRLGALNDAYDTITIASKSGTLDLIEHDTAIFLVGHYRLYVTVLTSQLVEVHHGTKLMADMSTIIHSWLFDKR
ncbi:serine hydrolase [Kurthia sibirica]|uniref:Serine hydrolase n=1 Tax=Kurthia sibirica TaxID=202750 RepID=A0A2U3ALD3_9BACL|nr:serine hydrolase [Kurthia sibirica]PWI25329.1 serine hydrolase [Kurthia sibirica]GEK34425.1 serine hydrolase [Kurthia sibirica]